MNSLKEGMIFLLVFILFLSVNFFIHESEHKAINKIYGCESELSIVDNSLKTKTSDDCTLSYDDKVTLKELHSNNEDYISIFNWSMFLSLLVLIIMRL